MRYVSMIISLLFTACTCLTGKAQQPGKFFFRHIDQADGLLHNLILSIAQDGRGFMWILTPNGLQRYDGSSFVNYLYDISNPEAIPFINESRLFTDKSNKQLWRVSHGLEKLNIETNKFVACNANQLINDPSYFFETYRDSLNNSWMVGKAGVFRFENDKGKAKPFYVTTSYPSPGKSGPFYRDTSTGQSWLTGWAYSILLFDQKTKKIYSPHYNPLHHPLLEFMNVKKPGLEQVIVDSEKNIWMASNGESFYRYDPFTKKVTTYTLADIRQKFEKNKTSDATLLVNCFFEDSHHSIWIGTRNAGLLKYNREEDNFIAVTGDNEDQQHIRYNYNIGCIFQDDEENIWLGTDKGISIFNPYRQYFQSVSHDENNPLSLPKNEIQECIETVTGNILIATWGGGISVYDSQWHFKKNIRFPALPREYNLTWNFIQNDNGTIWIGCQHGYIHMYDPLKETINTIHPPEFHNFTIRCMAKDKYGNILFGLYNGKIAKWDKLQNKFYGYNENIKTTVQSFSQVFSLYIDSRQRCWVGCEFGIKEFDEVNMIYKAEYLPDKNNPHTILGTNVQSIEELNDSTLLIGTVYGGMNFFNTNARTFSHLNVSNGFPSNTINNVKKDQQGQVWFTSDYGLYKYSPGNKKIIHYNIEPGILNSTFKRGKFYCLKDGRWLACTETEIISFKPDVLQALENNDSRVYITGVRVFDKNIPVDSLLYNKLPVNLSHKQNFLSIEYGALNFSGLKETKYYYQLKGIDREWVSAGAKRVANYTNLSPGDYTFSVKTADADNSGQITSFIISIAPPFWQTAWFKMLLIIFAAATIWVIFKKRIKTIRHEAEINQRVAETEMMALRAQMNPHFIFNCLNAIDNLIQTNQKGKATSYLNRFAKLIRSVLDSSKNNLVSFHKDYETLRLFLELEQFRCSDKFEYELSADAELLNSDIKVPPLIVQPFVENAIHHGLVNKEEGDCKLAIDIKLEKDYIKYTIIDNGIGRKQAALLKAMNKPEHVPYGIEISRKRVELHNHNGVHESILITDLEKDGVATGTKVEFWLSPQ